jgi:predicted regulator of Ras-like GTPase activity (Roadblock/LC7/MglB family)
MFVETLKDIADRLEEVDGVLLMGMDGLPIEKVIRNDSLNIEALTAEFTTVIKLTNLTTAEVDAGRLDEVIILSDKMILLTKSITSEYFLLMILSHGGNLGRARFELKKAKYVLEKEFV